MCNKKSIVKSGGAGRKRKVYKMEDERVRGTYETCKETISII